MIIVIQCAGSKRHEAGRLMTARGKPVSFVAQPHLAPPDDTVVYAKPDDVSDDARSWRQILSDYNRDGRNLDGLYPAYRLYRDAIYERLAERVTVSKLYILSAGWGLIRADFLTPYYDITFSQMKRDAKFKQRRPQDRYEDFAMMPTDTAEPVIFFGGQSYVRLFAHLTRGVQAQKTIFYNTEAPPDAAGCKLQRYVDAKRNTNWQYDCANAFLDGSIII